MESTIQTSNVKDGNSDLDYSQEFKEEMENSIISYFNECHLTDEQHPSNKTEIIRDNTLIDNNNQDVEYIKRMSSLKGITDYIITNKAIPIDYSSDNESIKQEKNNDNLKSVKMSTCNSDETLNEESININDKKEDTEITDITEKNKNENNNVLISESFAHEFISLLDINMKELNNKKDDFHIIGLKKDEEVKEDKPKTETPEVKIKEEFLEASKPNKRRKHNSILITLGKKCSTNNLFRSKSINPKSSSKKHHHESIDFKSSPKENENESLGSDKLKKSKLRKSISKIFKSFKRKSVLNVN